MCCYEIQWSVLKIKQICTSLPWNSDKAVSDSWYSKEISEVISSLDFVGFLYHSFEIYFYWCSKPIPMSLMVRWNNKALSVLSTGRIVLNISGTDCVLYKMWIVVEQTNQMQGCQGALWINSPLNYINRVDVPVVRATKTFEKHAVRMSWRKLNVLSINRSKLLLLTA